MTVTEPWPDEAPLFVPVAGPAPFNTLVVAQGIAQFVPFAFSPDGNLHLGTATAQTNFVLPQFDPRQPPPKFQHSTAVWLTTLDGVGIANFTAAINGIQNAFFDFTGRWTVTLDVAALAESDGNRLTDAALYGSLGFSVISSWVLCSLPPVKG